MRILKENPTIFMILLFVATIGLVTLDPLSLNPEGLEGTGFAVIWYFLPALLLWGIFIVRPSYSARAGVDEGDVRAQKIKSVLRHVVTSLTAIIALKAGLGLNIPYIDQIFNVLKYALGQTDQVVNAIMTLISFGTVVWGFIKQRDRHELTAKAQSKGRKYEPKL